MYKNQSPTSQARNKSTKIEFLGPEAARWGGGLPREGVVAEKFVPSLETLSSLGFEERNPGCPGNFAGMSRTPAGVQKVCAKKVRAHFSFPNKVECLCFYKEKETESGLKSGAGEGGLKFSSEIENFKPASHQTPICTRPRLGPFFYPEIRAFTGFGARCSSTVSTVLSDRKVLFKTHQWP